MSIFSKLFNSKQSEEKTDLDMFATGGMSRRGSLPKRDSNKDLLLDVNSQIIISASILANQYTLTELQEFNLYNRLYEELFKDENLKEIEVLSIGKIKDKNFETTETGKENEEIEDKIELNKLKSVVSTDKSKNKEYRTLNFKPFNSKYEFIHYKKDFFNLMGVPLIEGSYSGDNEPQQFFLYSILDLAVFTDNELANTEKLNSLSLSISEKPIRYGLIVRKDFNFSDYISDYFMLNGVLYSNETLYSFKKFMEKDIENFRYTCKQISEENERINKKYENNHSLYAGFYSDSEREIFSYDEVYSMIKQKFSNADELTEDAKSLLNVNLNNLIDILEALAIFKNMSNANLLPFQRNFIRKVNQLYPLYQETLLSYAKMRQGEIEGMLYGLDEESIIKFYDKFDEVCVSVNKFIDEYEDLKSQAIKDAFEFIKKNKAENLDRFLESLDL